MKVLSLAFLSLLLINSCSSENIDNSDPVVQQSEETADSNCNFESVNELSIFSYQFNDSLWTEELEKVPVEQFELLFDSSKHPSPRKSFFVGKFKIVNRTGLVTYNDYENAMGNVFYFYQLHILEDCSNVFTEYLALNDSDVMIYQIQSKLSQDFTELEITRIHSSYNLVGEDISQTDTLFTEIYTVDLSGSELTESLVSTEFELIKY